MDSGNVVFHFFNNVHRFRLYGVCCDETGAIRIVWPDDEITRLTGKTVYDVEAENTEVSFLTVPKEPK